MGELLDMGSCIYLDTHDMAFVHSLSAFGKYVSAELDEDARACPCCEQFYISHVFHVYYPKRHYTICPCVRRKRQDNAVACFYNSSVLCVRRPGALSLFYRQAE